VGIEQITSETIEQYMCYAENEYGKLKRYINHIFSKNESARDPQSRSEKYIDITPTTYEYNYYNTTSYMDQKISNLQPPLSDPPFINDIDNDIIGRFYITNQIFITNNHIVKQIKCNIANMYDIKRSICTDNEIIEREKHTVNSKTNYNLQISNHPENRQINDVEEDIKKIEIYIKELTLQKTDLIYWKNKYQTLESNRKLLGKFECIHNLYIRILQFQSDCLTIYNIPDEIVRIIQSYIGIDFLEKIRQHCITQKYFPYPRDIIRDEHNSIYIKLELEDLLKKWRIVDLSHYSKQTFIRYDIDYDHHRPYKWRRRSLRNSCSKIDAINYILRGKNIHSFYEIQRDIIILTKILYDNRIKRRKTGSSANSSIRTIST